MTAPTIRATLRAMSPEARIALSERVISGWEAIGKPGGSVPDNMRMIGEELAKLREIAAADPGLKDRADAIGERYGRMALKVKLGAH